MARWLTLLSTGLFAAAIASAATNRIYQRNTELQPGVHYDIYQREQRVVIYQGVQGQVFQFDAVIEDEQQQYLGPGDINYMSVSSNAGQVVLTLVGYQGRPYGARTVKRLDLVNPGATATIQEMKIQANLGELGPTLAHTAGAITVDGIVLQDLEFDYLTGDLTIEKVEFFKNITVAQGTSNTPDLTIRHTFYGQYGGGAGGRIHVWGDMGTIHFVDGFLDARLWVQDAHDVDRLIIGPSQFTGWMSIDGDLGSLDADVDLFLGYISVWGTAGTQGPITVSGTIGDDCGDSPLLYFQELVDEFHAGALTSGGQLFVGNVVAPITLADPGQPVPMGGTIYVQGELRSAITVNGSFFATSEPRPCQGHLVVQGDVTSTGSIVVTGSIPHPMTIQLESDLAGLVEIRDELGGEVQIGGSFLPGARVLLNALDPESGAVAVDWDGWHAGHDWSQQEPRPYVRVGTPPYHVDLFGNTPDMHIWEIQCNKGDMDNNGLVNFFDIDPFYLAMQDEAAYDQAYPGLWGSLCRRSNCDCDTSCDIDQEDADAFVRRLVAPAQYQCEYNNCDPCLAPCEGQPGGDGLDPLYVAALHRKYVAPQRLPLVMEVARKLAVKHQGTSRGRFWAAVLAELEK